MVLLLLKKPEDAGGVRRPCTIPRQQKNSLAGSSTARFARSKLSRSKEDKVGVTGEGVVGYLPTMHGEMEHVVCVEEVRQHNGLTLIHNSLGHQSGRQGNSRYLFLVLL